MERLPTSRQDKLWALDRGALGGRYELRTGIGSSRVAAVYQAMDRLVGRQVAVKVFNPKYGFDPSFVERFQPGAEAAASLRHPHVVAIYDFGLTQTDEGPTPNPLGELEQGELEQAEGRDGRGGAGSLPVPFLVMEYVAGENLKQLIRRRGVIPEPEALALANQVAAALGAAHAQGIVHGNLSPQNVLVDAQHHVKVADFGIARALGPSYVTETAAILGTTHYLSPEQLQGHLVDGRADLYSLGIMLYELLTGQLPFAGESMIAVASQHVLGTPRPLRDLLPLAAPLSEAAVMRALATDPADRHQTAGQMRQAIEQARVQAIDASAPLTPPAALEPAGGRGLWGARRRASRPDPPRPPLSLPAPSPHAVRQPQTPPARDVPARRSLGEAPRSLGRLVPAWLALKPRPGVLGDAPSAGQQRVDTPRAALPSPAPLPGSPRRPARVPLVETRWSRPYLAQDWRAAGRLLALLALVLLPVILAVTLLARPSALVPANVRPAPAPEVLGVAVTPEAPEAAPAATAVPLTPAPTAVPAGAAERPAAAPVLDRGAAQAAARTAVAAPPATASPAG